MKSVFSAEDYLYFYSDHLKDEYSDEEVAFLIRELSLNEPRAILDLACGHGRHSNRLAGFGHVVTGVDQSSEFLDIAERDAEKKGVNVRYLCADSRSYCEEKTYDCIIHLFSSFGYFSDEENELVIRNVTGTLKEGGLFCLDILNRDTFLKDYPRFSVLEKNGDLMIDRNRFDPVSGRLCNSRIIIRDGIRKDLPFFLRLYNLNEITRILNANGLTIIKRFADWKGNPFDGKSRRMILVAQKYPTDPE
nr:class I SAM-dependent methyltransferase [uncultured Methanospirillum sp.]